MGTLSLNQKAALYSVLLLIGAALTGWFYFDLGAYLQLDVAQASGPEGKRMVCPPDPPPSRNASIAMFIEWAQAHPEYLNEPPVETEFRFLIETWPCNP